METKVCNKCEIEKTLDKFEYRKDKNAYRGVCKECRNKAARERYLLAKDKIDEARKDYYNDNKEKINERRRKKYNENKKEINKKRRELYNKNKDEINAKRRNKKKRELTPVQKLKEQVYNAIVKSYERKGFQRTKTVEEIIGKSLDIKVEQLIRQYEYHYKKKYTGKEKVHVDHIIPIWTARTVEELDSLNRCLQLLSESENTRKGGRMSNGIGKNGKVIYEYYDPHWFDEC